METAKLQTGDIDLLKKFVESRVPDEIAEVFDGLQKELKENDLPVVSVVPMMSLQGEWAIKKLRGKERGYGDVDWGVVIDCDPDEEDEVLVEIVSVGEKYLKEHGQDPCTEINPAHYKLNLSRVDEFVQDLPEAAKSYVAGDLSSSEKVVCASLPVLSGDNELASRFRDLVSEKIRGDIDVVDRAVDMCVDWMRSVKEKKSGVGEFGRDSLNYLRRLSHDKVTTPEVEGEERSFGLIAIKPEGMATDVPELVSYVLSLDKNEIRLDNEVLASMLDGCSDEEKAFFLKGLGEVSLRLSRFGDYSENNSFWEASYKDRHGHKYWYPDLMQEVNRGTLNAFVIESPMPQKDLERWLDIFKGKENIVLDISQDPPTVIRRGKGIRGMYDSEAVMVDSDLCRKALEGSGLDVGRIDEVLKVVDANEKVLFTDLPKDVAPFVWNGLTLSQRRTMLGNAVHMTGKMDEVFAGVTSLMLPEVGDSILNLLKKNGVSREKAVGVMVDICTLVKQSLESQVGMEEVDGRMFPGDNSERKGEFSYGMLVVKPTGMDGDFSEVFRYLFDPRFRQDEHREEIVGMIESTFGDDFRTKFVEILDKTVLEMSFYDAYEPGQSPYFWEANYWKKNGGKFYYKAMLDGFRGGKKVEIFLLRSTAPQEELDEWVKRVKGRENLTGPSSEGGDKNELLYRGYGVRGLMEVEAIMLTEERRRGLLAMIGDADKRTDLEEKMKVYKLPMIFSRLPNEIQAELWDLLPESEQQAMISNFIHSPDDIETNYEAVVELAKKYLSDEEIKAAIDESGGRMNVAVFDLITGIARRRLMSLEEKNPDLVLQSLGKFPGNTRAAMSATGLI